MEQDGKLGFIEVTDETEEKEIIQRVNLITEGYNVWRLLLFDGSDKIRRPAPKASENDGTDESQQSASKASENDGTDESQQSASMVSEKCMRLLEYYAGGNGTDIQAKCRCCPEEIWYLGWLERQDIIGRDFNASQGLSENLAGKVYFFCMIASMKSEIARRYAEFMACCNLLILAINQFPVGFLSPLCLYFVEAEVDRNKFAEYVNRQYGDIAEIEKNFTLESQRLQEQRQKGVSCPRYSNVAIEELEQEEPPEIDKLKQRITWNKSEGNIEYALNQNSYEIRKWMHYPRGVISGVVDKLEEELDKEQMAGSFLSIAGKDLLKRQLENALEKLSIARKEVMEQKDFEYELRNRENRIRKRARKKLGLIQTLVTLLLAFVTEVPFLCFAFNMLHPFIGNGNMGEVEGICLIVVAVAAVVFVMLFAPRVSFYYERYHYVKFLKEQMKDKAERKRKYLQSTLELVAEYQYYVRLDKEQRRIEQEWEIQNKNLGRHLSVWQQSQDAKSRLRDLLDKEEQENVPSVKVNVDFEEEPQEISYYWMAYKGNCFKAELNDSGYMMEAALEFIIRFRCVDNPAKIDVLHF